MSTTMLPRNRLFVSLAIAFASIAWATPAPAQTASSLKIVVPLAAGGGADILARILAEEIGRAQHISAVVENRAGAGTMIGTEVVARATPDGETVLLTNPAFLINPHIKKVTYDPLVSFDPVCNMVNFPLVFVVPANSPLKSMADMIAMAKAKPGTVTVASAGTGNPTHIGFEVLKKATGLEMTYVSYPGAAPAVNALLGGHITAVYSDYGTISGQLKSGALRPIAVGSKARFAGLPDVPTIPELGYTDYEAESWNGILAPAKTPKDTLARLVSWFSAAGNSSLAKEKLGALGLAPSVLCGPEYSASLKRQYERFGTAIRAADIKAD
ncbi:MAG: tripartite tricarboxylate transporter substrate binding protein [Xanthobacteraceae bacterium]|nr:tripartite tricarboxylate transporter substrate binding protein [Xanthobacteraceae bacterium]